MQRHTDGTVTWLTFDHFEEFPSLVHGIFLRDGDLTSLNALRITEYCSLYQKHGTHIVTATPSKKEEGDGLTTNQFDIALTIAHADCQAAIFYDPIHHALAAIHCGWRGNVQNIYHKTVDTMHSLYSSQPQDLLVGISPSLGPDASEFINHKTELPPSFLQFQFKPGYFDLWAISRWQLEQCGILPHHIEIAQICTFSNPQDYFSYRRSKDTSRHITVACLKN